MTHNRGRYPSVYRVWDITADGGVIRKSYMEELQSKETIKRLKKEMKEVKDSLEHCTKQNEELTRRLTMIEGAKEDVGVD